MQVLHRLIYSAYGMHLADQIALVTVPLVAVLVFDASARDIGLLVAAQSLAHLLGSLPSGLIVDRLQPQKTAVIATSVSFAGFTGVALSIALENLLWFGIAVTFSGFGIVLFVLVCLSVLPRISNTEQLAVANARFEIPRALTSFVVPLAVGLVITATVAQWIYGVAAAGGLLALALVIRLPMFEVNRYSPEGGVKRLLTGAMYVVKQPYLLPITLCAVFWNLAFSALLVVMVPLLVETCLLDPGTFGICLSFFGFAAIVGAWTAGRIAAYVAPGVILLFGPGSSVLAALVLMAASAQQSVAIVYASFFVLGFGPSMWLISQNSIRQLVTPSEMLGSVNAVIQTAIYGVRPLGALLGGSIVSATSITDGLVFVTVCFAASFAAVLFSRLTFIHRYTDLGAGGRSQ